MAFGPIAGARVTPHGTLAERRGVQTGLRGRDGDTPWARLGSAVAGPARWTAKFFLAIL